MPSSCIGQIVAALYHDSCGDIASNYCVCYARSWLKIARRVGVGITRCGDGFVAFRETKVLTVGQAAGLPSRLVSDTFPCSVPPIMSSSTRYATCELLYARR